MDLASSRAWRAFAAWTALKAAAALAALFVVVRIAIPYLIDAHDDAMLLAAVVLGIASALGAGWLAIWLWLSIARFRKTLTNHEGSAS